MLHKILWFTLGGHVIVTAKQHAALYSKWAYIFIDFHLILLDLIV